jgi:hypothetical protein
MTGTACGQKSKGDVLFGPIAERGLLRPDPGAFQPYPLLQHVSSIGAQAMWELPAHVEQISSQEN